VCRVKNRRIGANANHEGLEKFVEHRIADRRVVRLIQNWLNAGVPALPGAMSFAGGPFSRGHCPLGFQLTETTHFGATSR